MNLSHLVARSGLLHPALIVEPLAGGAPAPVEPGRQLYPASMIKVPLAAAVLIMIERAELDESAAIEIGPGNMTENDAPSPLVPGYRASLEELLFLTIARSDNVGTNQLFDVAGRERASGLVQSVLGLPDTAFRRKLSGDVLIEDAGQTGRNTHPPADAARLFRLIASDAFPGSRRLLAYLERQEWNTKLSAGLRPGDRFAHKTGDTSEVSHDGGILTTAGGERYVVVAYSASASTTRPTRGSPASCGHCARAWHPSAKRRTGRRRRIAPPSPTFLGEIPHATHTTRSARARRGSADCFSPNLRCREDDQGRRHRRLDRRGFRLRGAPTERVRPGKRRYQSGAINTGGNALTFEFRKRDRRESGGEPLSAFTTDGTAIILGPTLSGEAFKAQPLAVRANVPVLAPRTRQTGSGEGPCIFRDSLSEYQVIPTTIKKTHEPWKYKTAAIIYGDDNAFTKTNFEILAPS